MNITIKEEEKGAKGIFDTFTPDACWYDWTYYSELIDQSHIYSINDSYCCSYEKAKVEELIKKTKSEYENDPSFLSFDMSMDCGDKEEKKDKDKEKEE